MNKAPMRVTHVYAVGDGAGEVTLTVTNEDCPKNRLSLHMFESFSRQETSIELHLRDVQAWAYTLLAAVEDV